MSTRYTFVGGINITPALNYTEVKTARKTALGLVRTIDKKYATEENVFREYMPLGLMLDSFTKDTDDGPLKIIQGIALESTLSDSWMPIPMDVLVRGLIKALPGHDWKGTVTALHEDRLTAYKLIVDCIGTESRDQHEVVRLVEGTAHMTWDEERGVTIPLSHLC